MLLASEMDETPLKITKELLEKRSYERSFAWSHLMKEASKADDCEDFDLADIEEICAENQKANECSESENMAEEVPDEKESGEICSQDVLSIIQNLTFSNARGIIAQINDRVNETGIIGTEVQRVLEETLPIVEEYQRDWLEAGFERVLKTFDLKQIEEKVGSWMLRNNSCIHQNFPLALTERFHPYQVKKTHFVREMRGIEETDSDSLHSDDTARYIRSSRKHLGMSKRVATMTTTTIKSYRMVKNKRDELRKKYGYLSPDDTMKILQTNHCRQIPFGYCGWQGYLPNRERRIVPESVRIRRRRHRRSCNSPSTTFTSSDEEFTPRGRKLLKPLCCSRNKYHTYKVPLPTRKKYRKNHDDSLDDIDRLQPYSHESDCACRGMDTLCNNVRHFANSSTESWLVDNSESPMIVLPPTDEDASKAKCGGRVLDYLNEKCEKNPSKLNQDVKKAPKETASKSVISKGKRAGKTSAKYKESSDEESINESFELELQKAIKLSKELHEAELKKQLKSDFSAADKADEQRNEVKDNMKKKNTKRPDSQASVCQSSEESHTASKLALQLSSDLQLNEAVRKQRLPKSNSAASSKTFVLSDTESEKSSSNPVTENSGQSVVGNSTKRSTHSKTQSRQIAQQDKPRQHIRKGNTKAKKQDSNSETDDKLPIKTKKVNTPSLASSSSDTENIRRIRKKLDTKPPTLKTINECKSDDSDDTKISSKGSTEGSYRKALTSTYCLPENTTFFVNSGNICNSTAVANNTAINRQLLINNAPPTVSSVPTKQTKKLPTTKKGCSTAVRPVSRTENSLPENNVLENHLVSKKMDDCSMISSTTDSDLHQQTVVPNVAKKLGESVILYSPNNASLVPDNSIVKGRFMLTENHLASIIGDKNASKFMKYYAGPLEFPQSSTVYYEPPETIPNSDSSDSDIDFLDVCDRYGKLNETKQKKKL